MAGVGTLGLAVLLLRPSASHSGVAPLSQRTNSRSLCLGLFRHSAPSCCVAMIYFSEKWCLTHPTFVFLIKIQSFSHQSFQLQINVDQHWVALLRFCFVCSSFWSPYLVRTYYLDPRIDRWCLFRTINSSGANGRQSISRKWSLVLCLCKLLLLGFFCDRDLKHKTLLVPQKISYLCWIYFTRLRPWLRFTVLILIHAEVTDKQP